MSDMPKKNMLSLQLDVASFEAATEEEKRQQVRMRESTTFFKDGMRRLAKNKIAMICLCLIVLVILIVAFVPSFYPYEYSDQLGITPGQPSDASYNNLKPFEYGETELELAPSEYQISDAEIALPAVPAKNLDGSIE